VAWAIRIETWIGGVGVEGGLLGVEVGHPYDLVWGLLGVWHGWELVNWVRRGRNFQTSCFTWFGLGLCWLLGLTIKLFAHNLTSLSVGSFDC